MKKVSFILLTLAGISGLHLTSCANQESMVQDSTINDEWELFAASTTDAEDSTISTSQFAPSNAENIKLPATVLSGLRQNGHFEDLYFNMGLKKIDKKPFSKPWWYRKELTLEQSGADLNYQLIFEGLNYKADLWINGQKISGPGQMEGAFGVYQFNVTPLLTEGKNIIAVKVFPPQKGDLTLGFVDWNPEAPDGNMGLWRGVRLKTTRSIALSHPNVRSSVNTQTLEEATLTVSVFTKNLTDSPQKTVLKAVLLNSSFSKTIQLKPGEEKEVFFESEEFPELQISNPQLWWPNNMGDQPLHQLKITSTTNHHISDISQTRFGIRQIEDYFTDEGHRGFKVNGKKFLVKGGGWVDDMLLADNDEKVKAQIDYVKQMNMNTIRLEGFWGNNNTLYNYCDEQGIMLMTGWSCQWEWEGYCGRPEGRYMSVYPEEYERESAAYRQQVLRTRSHPSMLLWTYGSDKLPHPDLEAILNRHMTEIAPDAPVVTTCRGVEVGGHQNTSEISGPSGVKMLGPYDWVPPVYWYTDTLYGGAYGFNTETGPGPQIPPIESIKKMLPEKNWWPIDSLWQHHFGRNEFGTIDRYLKAFNARYGESTSLEEFTFKNQMSSYEAIRGMFEAFAVNKYKATGVIQWMLNSAWPEMYWQLYDYYLRPNGAFYGTKKACAPLTPIYNYKDQNVYVNNDYLHEYGELTLSIRIYSSNSEILFSEDHPFSISANQSEKVFDLPDINNLSTTWFLDLRINDETGKELANNFYWLSTKQDVPDFATTTWVYTPTVEFADFSEINQLEPQDLTLSVDKEIRNQKVFFYCTLKNEGEKLAFFNELLANDNNSGDVILPVFWEDNYITLLPGEERTITGSVNKNGLEVENIAIEIKNLNTINIRD
jgi:exo-1,4-beta-D-glucosaminidase